MLKNYLGIHEALLLHQSAYSSFISEKAFVRAVLSDGDCQEVHGHIGHGHSVQVGERGFPGRGR